MDKQIDKYRIPLVGEYNPLIYVCKFCNYHFPKTMDNYAIGFADCGQGFMMVVECSKCFEKFYFHGRSYVNSFLLWKSHETTTT